MDNLKERGEGFESADLLWVMSTTTKTDEGLLSGVNRQLMEKLLSEASEKEALISDIYLTSLITFDFSKSVRTSVSAKEVNKEKKKIFKIINDVDPEIIVFSGEMAAKKLSGIPARKFSYGQLMDGGIQEGLFPGEIIDVPRAFIVVPSIDYLVENFSTKRGSDTHKTYLKIQKAFKYIDTVKGAVNG
tara:strand:- start:596 stop:1159 length:564 start_codon:yes stop_codon:yes gene_type:complete